MGMPQAIQMANLGMADSLILMVMALVVFGPRRLPQIGRQIGKLMYEYRKASNDFKFQMEEELRNAEEADRRKQDEERMRALAATTQAPTLSAPEPVTSLLPSSSIDSDAAAAPVESPYPNEEVNPQAIAASTEPAPEETALRILPPSTGEQVEAARPNRHTALAQAAHEQGPAVAEQADFVFEPAPIEQPAPDAQPDANPEQAVPHA